MKLGFWLLLLRLPATGSRLPAVKPRMRVGNDRAVLPAQGQEIEQCRVAQLRGADVAQRAGDGLDATGGLAFPGIEHLPDLLALQVLLRAATIRTEARRVRQECVSMCRSRG